MKKVLFLALIIALSIFALCACEDKKQDNQGSGDVVVANDNEEKDTTDVSAVVGRERTPEEVGKFTVVYNDVDFGTGVFFDKIKDELGQELKPSDTSKACGPFVKGETTHYYFDGLTIDVNYQGMINYIYLNGNKASLSCGAKIGMSVDEIKALVGESTEDEYSISVKLGDDFYVTFIKDDDGTVNHISIDDMAIEN